MPSPPAHPDAASPAHGPRAWLDTLIARFTAVGEDGAVIRNNFGWLAGDRAFRLVVGLVVNVWMVRSLGAAGLGLLSFVQSLVGLLAIFAWLGFESIVVRDLVRAPGDAPRVLGTTALLRLAGAAVTLALTLAAIAATRGGDARALALAMIFAVAVFAQALDGIDYWFQSRSTVRPPVLARSAAFVLASLLKVACLVTGAPLEWLAAAVAAEVVLAGAALAVAYRVAGGRLGSWRFDPLLARRLLADAWPLALAGLAIMLYVRTDQVMITLLRGDHENGIYAAAQRLSEILYFIPSALVVAANPALLRSHATDAAEYHRRLGRLMMVLTWIAIGLALPISLLSGFLTRTLFGAEFAASGPVLALHVWAAPAVFMGVAQSNWFIARGEQGGLLLRTAVGAATNIGLNFVLIPRYGAIGAALATLVAQVVASILINAVVPSSRPLFRMQLRAFLPGAPR